jgi:hypothetical protein
MSAQEHIWYDDLAGWFTAANYYKVMPSESMSLAERLNAVTRLFLYIGIVLTVVTFDYRYLVIGIAACLLSIAMYEFDRRKKVAAERFLDENDLTIMDRKVCARSTVDNPFMNANLVTDARDRPSACDVSHPAIAAQIEGNFGKRVFTNATDIYGRESSSRQFYTMPSSGIMSDQEGYANWLYGSAPTCKENSTACFDRNGMGRAWEVVSGA